MTAQSAAAIPAESPAPARSLRLATETAYLVLYPDSRPPLRARALLRCRPTVEDLQRIVLPILRMERQGADMEHVTVLYEGQRRDMFVDEYGALKATRQPVNDAATAIYRESSRRAGLRIANPSSIHGVAVLFSEREVWF